MILRKPYAFLIKHFKLIHLIISACMIYLIFRTELMINFINEYINAVTSVVGQPIVSELYNVWVIVLPIIVLVFSIILLLTMAVKNKPKTYYVLMIGIHVALIATYFYGYTVFYKMQNTIVDLKTIKALRDVLMYCIIFQGAFSIATIVRGIGFDIKKFDFGSDLDGLELSDADNEEFELDIDFDLNDQTRKGKRILRNLKYKYRENKFVVHIVLGVFAAIFIFYIYNNFNIYNKTSPEGTNFNMNGFTMGVTKSYTLNQNSLGQPIGDGSRYLVVVDLNVKNNSATPKELATGNIELDVSGILYHHTDQYEAAVTDLGLTYKKQNLKNEFTHYLLVYEIPANKANSKMKLQFTNTANNEKARVRLNPNKLSEKETETKEATLGETISFEGSTLGNTTLKINSFDVKNRFTLNYNYCSSRSKTCVNSVEYVMPQPYSSNYKKALLQLDVELNVDENFTSSTITNFTSIFQYFGKIEYELEGIKKSQTVYLGQASSKRSSKNTYYIEVFQEIKAADKITLVFQIRNHIYRYSLK